MSVLPMQSFIDALLLSDECKPNAAARHFFDKKFIKALIPRLPGGNVSILSHDICRLIRDHDPGST